MKTLLCVGLALISASPMAAQSGDLTRVLKHHVSRYPEMQPEDLYKLLHQASMGSAHAVSDRAAARQWLRKEIESLHDPGTTELQEPSMEPLSPDGRLVRIQLRPFLRAGGDPDALFEAWVETGEQYRGDPATLDGYCEVALTLARDGLVPFSPSELEALFLDLREQGYPAIHHSAQYREAYRPAYRVVLRELLSID